MLMKTTIPSFLITLLIACLGLPQNVLAVTPAPDGGYPGSNTAEGTDALLSLTSGIWNTALGNQALRNDTNGELNTATGVQALFSNISGGSNTATGVWALYGNTVGGNNSALGAYALANNIDGNFNTANGYLALFSNRGGDGNTASGYNALFRNTGSNNTASGNQALYNTTGLSNTAMGSRALYNSTTGGGNTALGMNAGTTVTTASNVICIGAGLAGANVSNSCYIGNIYGRSGGSQPVFVNSQGKLGFQSSSRRFKDEIKPMDRASEVIYRLKPVSFRYKPEVEPTRPLSFGLVAEDVEQISPDLVIRGSDGKGGSVRFDAVNAMLLNEFLKEHRKVNEQEATIAELKSDTAKQQATISQLKKEMEAVVASLKEHDAKIQKVSAQIEVSNPVGEMALNNP